MEKTETVIDSILGGIAAAGGAVSPAEATTAMTAQASKNNEAQIDAEHIELDTTLDSISSLIQHEAERERDLSGTVSPELTALSARVQGLKNLYGPSQHVPTSMMKALSGMKAVLQKDLSTTDSSEEREKALARAETVIRKIEEQHAREQAAHASAPHKPFWHSVLPGVAAHPAHQVHNDKDNKAITAKHNNDAHGAAGIGATVAAAIKVGRTHLHNAVAATLGDDTARRLDTGINEFGKGGSAILAGDVHGAVKSAAAMDSGVTRTFIARGAPKIVATVFGDATGSVLSNAGAAGALAVGSIFGDEKKKQYSQQQLAKALDRNFDVTDAAKDAFAVRDAFGRELAGLQKFIQNDPGLRKLMDGKDKDNFAETFNIRKFMEEHHITNLKQLDANKDGNITLDDVKMIAGLPNQKSAHPAANPAHPKPRAGATH